MSTLLRKVKSTINAVPTSNENRPNNNHTGNHSFFRNSRRSRIDLGAAVESQHSIEARERYYRQQHHGQPITEFRKRLARKASTFSLRTKNRRSQLRSQHEEEQIEQKRLEDELLEEKESITRTKDQSLSESRPDSTQYTRLIPAEQVILRPTHPISQEARRHSTILLRSPSSTVSEQTIKEATARASAAPTVVLESLLSDIQAQQLQRVLKGDIESTREGNRVYVKMADQTASPPLPFTRLKEIADNACDAALSSITSYAHASTETWNTTIINSILGTLVKETTPSTSGQPQYKYVVNSTIIQHAATSTSSGSEDKAVSGRRGMHAASGAYWNNEKDGMFSCKYEAAESKGLDVVVGIIWVWAG